jgi:hypothetical protein
MDSDSFFETTPQTPPQTQIKLFLLKIYDEIVIELNYYNSMSAFDFKKADNIEYAKNLVKNIRSFYLLARNADRFHVMNSEINGFENNKIPEYRQIILYAATGNDQLRLKDGAIKHIYPVENSFFEESSPTQIRSSDWDQIRLMIYIGLLNNEFRFIKDYVEKALKK